MKTIYIEGRKAFREGKHTRANPYQPHASLWDWAAWHAWSKGWLDAYNETSAS